MTKRKADVVTGIVLAIVMVAVAAAAIAFTGCAARVKTVTNLPAGVTQKQAQNWDAAVADLHKIAATTSTLRQTVILLNQKGVIPDGAAYANILTSIGRVDQLQWAGAVLLQGSPNNFSVSVQAQVNSFITSITAELQALNTAGATGIKDPASLQSVNALLGDIAAAANLELALTQ